MAKRKNKCNVNIDTDLTYMDKLKEGSSKIRLYEPGSKFNEYESEVIGELDDDIHLMIVNKSGLITNEIFIEKDSEEHKFLMEFMNSYKFENYIFKLYSNILICRIVKPKYK